MARLHPHRRAVADDVGLRHADPKAEVLDLVRQARAGLGYVQSNRPAAAAETSASASAVVWTFAVTISGASKRAAVPLTTQPAGAVSSPMAERVWAMPAAKKRSSMRTGRHMASRRSRGARLPMVTGFMSGI